MNTQTYILQIYLQIYTNIFTNIQNLQINIIFRLHGYLDCMD